MVGERFTKEEKTLLSPFVTNINKPVFVLKNLPEVIKGALFSRYSRSIKGLRRLLLDDFILNPEVGFKQITKFNVNDSLKQTLAIQKAEDFYQRILDGYGDDSIGELGGAHIACENVSNIASKHLEDARIGGSPLEKSTRYVWFDKKIKGDFMFYKEPEIMKSRFADLYLEANRFLFSTYAKFIEPMMEYYRNMIPQEEGVSDIAYRFSIRAKACDTLRGLLPASTMTNVGIFGNGRFFESLLIKFRSNPLQEMKDLADAMQAELAKVIPSFVRRASPSHKHFPPFKTYFTNTRKRMERMAKKVTKNTKTEKADTVELVEYDRNAEIKIISAMLYPYTRLPEKQLKKMIKKMSLRERKKIIEAYMGGRTNRRHKPGRALENIYYKFDILTDFGSYRDLHRHRMLTQERQDLTTEHGYYIPKELIDAGFEKEYRECMKVAETAYKKIYRKFPTQAQYMVPFAYKIRWYYNINLRAAYWLSELRSTKQGHPTYRFVAQEMFRKIEKVHPTLAYYMKFVDLKDYPLGRLEAEMKKEKKKYLNH